MKILDKTIKGPVDQSWLLKGPSPYLPQEPNSLLDTWNSPEFRVKTEEATENTGKPLKDEINNSQDALKRKLFWHLLEDTEPEKIAMDLRFSFDSDFLMKNASLIQKVMNERGLYGRVYIDSKLFPNCQNGQGLKTVTGKCKTANFIIHKHACEDCTCNQDGMCRIYHKNLVDHVPWDESTLEHYNPYLMREKGVSPGMPVSPSDSFDNDIKVTIKEGFLAQHEEPIRISSNNQVAAIATRTEVIAEKANPEIALIRRIGRKILGSKDPDLNDFVGTHTFNILANQERGLFGPVYVRLDLFDSCHEAKKFLDKVGNTAPYVISPEYCQHYDEATGKCGVLDRVMVKSMQYDSRVAAQVLKNAVREGRVTKEASTNLMSKLGDVDSKTIRSLLAKITQLKRNYSESIKSYDKENVYKVQATNEDPNLARTVRAYVISKMNEGFYGKDLQEIIGVKFSEADLKKAEIELKPVMAEQGLMGIYYLDPSVYKSCVEGSQLLRSKGIKYVKAMKKCDGCMSNSEGFCTKYNKPVVAEIPYIDKKAQQEEILKKDSFEPADPADILEYSTMLDQLGLRREADNIKLSNEYVCEPELDITLGGMVLDEEFFNSK